MWWHNGVAGSGLRGGMIVRAVAALAIAALAGGCFQPLYGDRSLDGTSLWITVQRRFVYADGCAPASFDSRALQRQLEAIPDVEQVFVRLRAGPHAPPPYKTLEAPE